ncbi:probable serine/threonine-protein kinase samkC [Camellia sinensis]|uniref:probable serine/threonine-protein kinase samkC n=1 Tax=Camellia sinensis TaxID=4442 RepID=UPI001035DD21|nr:probable serine/threonine-protein kinase samkC [Camellia sinensis]
MTTKRKQRKQPCWAAGSMANVSQPAPTTNQSQHQPLPQSQPQPAQQQSQPQPQMTMKPKQPRWTAGSMADVSQPASTTNQSHPQPQPRPQPQSESQSQPPQPLGNNMTPTVSFSQQSNHELQSSSGAVSIATSTGQSTIRQTRGPGRPFTRWGTGQKLKVTLNEENQPIGDEAAKLQSQLGILARNGNFAPLTFNDWRAPQLNPYKECIWQEVKV